MTGRSVLREHRTPWKQPPVFVGDEVFLTIPAPSTAGAVRCLVETPDGRKLKIDGRRREHGVADVCAVLTAPTAGRFTYTWSLPNGKTTGGGFRVVTRGKRKHT